jgi:nitrogen fixation/metabolism regulation signal transduction histidine kinase
LNESISNRVLEPLVSGSHLGLGLGLAFVRDIVEKHGGSFSLKNNIGAQGVTAFVRLPKK